MEISGGIAAASDETESAREERERIVLVILISEWFMLLKIRPEPDKTALSKYRTNTKKR